MHSSKIKTVLIEDSGFMRIFLSDLLRRDENIEVIATAKNGKEGVEKVMRLEPDVVITNMIMPEYDGLYVVQQLMKKRPLPIILLSSLSRTDPIISDALAKGAFDFIDKPRDTEISYGYPQLTTMVHEASLSECLKLKPVKRVRNTFVKTFKTKIKYEIIAIGSSTGGPSALEYIVSNLPVNLALPIVIAQHMPERFLESFASRLAETTGLNVSVASECEPLLDNHIYIAPGEVNMRIKILESGPIAQFVNDSYQQFNNPSIDCLFESVANNYKAKAIGIILTGMGKDGVLGLHKIREAGGLTIAQDELSSVVYGMPKVAFESGAAMYKKSLSEIPNFIVNAL